MAEQPKAGRPNAGPLPDPRRGDHGDDASGYGVDGYAQGDDDPGYGAHGYTQGDDDWSPDQYFSPEGIKGRWAGESPGRRSGRQGSDDDPLTSGAYHVSDGEDDGGDRRRSRRARPREDRGDRASILPRLRRDRGEDIWPDDGISDEDYWASVAADRPLFLAFAVTIYLEDGHIHDQVEAAVENLLATAGLQVVERDEPIIGSWFRSMRANVRQAAHSPAAREAALYAAHNVDSRVSLQRDATVTAMLLQNLGPVIGSLQPTKDAVLRVGALLIVKVD